MVGAEVHVRFAPFTPGPLGLQDDSSPSPLDETMAPQVTLVQHQVQSNNQPQGNCQNVTRLSTLSQRGWGAVPSLALVNLIRKFSDA